MEAAIGFEPMHGGFADLSLNHLGTPPRSVSQSRPDPMNYHAGESASIEHARGARRMRTSQSCTVTCTDGNVWGRNLYGLER